MDDDSLARPPLPSCWAAQFLPGHRLVPVHSLGVGDPCSSRPLKAVFSREGWGAGGDFRSLTLQLVFKSQGRGWGTLVHPPRSRNTDGEGARSRALWAARCCEEPPWPPGLTSPALEESPGGRLPATQEEPRWQRVWGSQRPCCPVLSVPLTSGCCDARRGQGFRATLRGTPAPALHGTSATGQDWPSAYSQWLS